MQAGRNSDGGEAEAIEASTTTKVDATRYRNILFAVGYVSRFMEDPRVDHWAAVKHLLRYIKGMTGRGVIFPKTGRARLQLEG